MSAAVTRLTVDDLREARDRMWEQKRPDICPPHVFAPQFKGYRMATVHDTRCEWARCVNCFTLLGLVPA